MVCRKVTKVKFAVLLIATLTILLLIIKNSANVNSTSKDVPTAENGVLDLRQWSFKEDGMLRVDGQWEFYENQILWPKDFENNGLRDFKYANIPGVFPNQGYGTYRVKLLFSDEDELFSIKIDFIQSAYKLWANNHEVMLAGKVGKDKEEMVPELAPKLGFFHTEKGEAYLTLQVSNFYNKYGFIDTILLGTSNQIKAYGDKKLAFDLFLFGCSVIAAIYSLGIFHIRRKDKASLYFAVVCIIVAIRTIFVGEGFLLSLFPSFEYVISGKIKVLTFYLYIPFIVLFINYCYGGLLSEKLMKLSNWSITIYTAIVIFLPYGVYLDYIIPFEIFALFMLGYMIIKISKLYFKNEQSEYIAVAGLFALFIVRINDILYEYSIIITGSFAALGILAFILANYFVLAESQGMAFSKVEDTSENLKTLNKLKDEFLAVTSHELKTPLNGIIGLSETLVSNDSAGLDYNGISDLNLINSSAKRLSNLVNDMLLFSSLKNNEIKLQRKPVNVRKIVDMVIKFSEAYSNNKNVSIWNLMDINTPNVFGDENRIQQIFHNLIGNAVKFTHEGEIAIGYNIQEEFLQIYVEDTGIGIAEEKVHKIFDLYEQVEGISEKYGGTGLGLYITKKIVELHGGTITVASKIKKGTKFAFTLPLYTQESKGEYVDCRELEDVEVKNSDKIQKTHMDKAAKKDNNEYNQMLYPSYLKGLEEGNNIDDHINYKEKYNLNTDTLRKHKILIVDDEYVNIKVLKNHFSMDKYIILEAFNGKEALILIEEHKDLDLVILDMMMPDFLGYEVCEVIRKSYSLFQLPVLIMTADNSLENLVLSFQCGANDYLKKPFNKYELNSRVNTLLTLKDSVGKALSLTEEITIANEQVENLSLNNERTTKRVEELIEYENLRTEFFANISHELRTPLNVISSTIQLLSSLDKSRSLRDEKIQYYFSIMNQNSLRLLRLINNLIDTTKVEGGYINLNLCNGDIVYIIEEISQSVAEYIKTHEITLIFDTEVEEKIIAFDEEKIERIILNILSNSIKFTPKNGTIFVNIYDKGDFIEISIKDTGIGIPKDKLEFIFQRFAQIDKSTTRQNEGSGIGLALVKSLVEMHGGKIFVNSEINKGSEFTISLPVRVLSQDEEKHNIISKEVARSKYEERLYIEFSDIYSK